MIIVPADIPKTNRSDTWINRVYFVLLPIILGITLIGLFVTLQTNNTNKDLNKQNLSCTRAVAEAIAKYTNDLVPIKLDPKTCIITPYKAGAATPTQPGPTVVTPPKPASTSPPAQSVTPNTKPNNDTTKTEQNPGPGQGDTPPEPKLLDCTIDLLGAHLGCP